MPESAHGGENGRAQANSVHDDAIVGVLHTPTEKGDGQLRDPEQLLRQLAPPNVVPRSLIDRFALRPGVLLEAKPKGSSGGGGNKSGGRRRGGGGGRKGPSPAVGFIDTVDGVPAGDYTGVHPMAEAVPLDPQPQLKLDHDRDELTTRCIDILSPIGFGQRGLIVAPPRVGKTMLLQNIARGIGANYPDVELDLLLVDERPEEVTDMRRNVPGTVYASSNDNDAQAHMDLATLVVERAKRRVELGKDVVILLDSLTRLGRAFNRGSNSGKTLSGGIDARALEVPKRLFGAARKLENGGSLTIIATCLIQTNSRMDDVIFEEFKGTGNMELVLDRKLADQRIYPAINVQASGTRKEELLMAPEELEAARKIRRHLLAMNPVAAMQTLLQALKKHPNNASFYKTMLARG